MKFLFTCWVAYKLDNPLWLSYEFLYTHHVVLYYVDGLHYSVYRFRTCALFIPRQRSVAIFIYLAQSAAICLLDYSGRMRHQMDEKWWSPGPFCVLRYDELVQISCRVTMEIEQRPDSLLSFRSFDLVLLLFWNELKKTCKNNKKML